MNLPKLNVKDLIAQGLKFLPFGQLLGGVFGAGNVTDGLKEQFKDKLDVQEARSGGKMLGRGLCEMIDNIMEDPALGTLDQRLAIAKGLAQQGALQSIEAAEAFLSYPELQYLVVKAKQSPNANESISHARKFRDAGTERVKEAYIDVARVVAGNAPREIKPPNITALPPKAS